MKHFTVALFFISIFSFQTNAQEFDIDTLQYTGDISTFINLVILGDGYQEAEFSKFIDDASNFMESFFQQTPYKEYRNYFNVFIIKVPSNESGADHPGTATDEVEPVHPVLEVDTYFDATFDSFEIHRLLVVDDGKVFNVLANNFPNYDQALVIVNTEYYGGSGGQVAVTSTNDSADEIAIHEIGHSFVGLADEYFAGDVFLQEKINLTQETDPLLVKWKNWYGDNEVGIFQHCCGGMSAEWYKPHENCKMQFLNSPFCSVCIEGTIEKIHALSSVVNEILPQEEQVEATVEPLEFELDLIMPDPNTLRIEWFINDVSIAKNTANVAIDRTELKAYENELKVIIEDTTQLLRIDAHYQQHSDSMVWTINNEAFDHLESVELCSGSDYTFPDGSMSINITAPLIQSSILEKSDMSGDSVVVTEIDITVFDLSISSSSGVLTANESDVTYQWLDCDNGMTQISGATDKIFMPESVGNYAVSLSRNDCEEISECVEILVVGTIENTFKNPLLVYPIPVENKLIVEFPHYALKQAYNLTITSVQGKTIYASSEDSERLSLDFNFPAGIYFITINDGKNQAKFRFIKN